MIAKTDLAYAAGLIDGEGCIFIGRTFHRRDKRITHVLQVKVSMVDTEALVWLRDKFRYTTRALTVAKRQTVNWNDVWTWHIFGAGAEEFLNLILPYLKVKKKQAEIALQFRALVSTPGIKLSEENFAERERLCLELKLLKARKSGKVRVTA